MGETLPILAITLPLLGCWVWALIDSVKSAWGEGAPRPGFWQALVPVVILLGGPIFGVGYLIIRWVQGLVDD